MASKRGLPLVVAEGHMASKRYKATLQDLARAIDPGLAAHLKRASDGAARSSWIAVYLSLLKVTEILDKETKG